MIGTSVPRTWNPLGRSRAWSRRRQELVRRDVLASIARQEPDASRGDVWYEVSRSRWNLSLTLVILVLDGLEAEGLVASEAVPSLARPGATRRAHVITPRGLAHLAGRAP